MRIEIFSPDMSNRHEVSHANSVQFSDLYNGVGKITVVLPMDDYNISIAEKGAILYIVDRNLAYEVAEVLSDTDGNTVTMNGFSLNNRLNRRVVAAEKKVVNVESDVYNVVNENLRGLAVELSPIKGLDDSIAETSIFGENVLDAVIPVLSEVGLGNRALFDYRSKTITWEIFKGNDLTSGIHAVNFVSERGTAPGLIIDRDESNYKNVCYCKAEYKDGTEFIVTAGTETGNNRREMWTDFFGEGQQDEESDSAFESRVKQYAALQLGSHRDRLGFTVDADGTELGTAYNVGDLVWCVSMRHGLKFKTRITEAIYTHDINGQSISLVVGDPILTVNM